MSQKEVDRAFVLAKVKEKQITLKQAAHAMLTLKLKGFGLAIKKKVLKV